MSEYAEPPQGLDPVAHPGEIPGQLVGYARVSAADQNLDRQVSTLRALGVHELFTEAESGAEKARPQLRAAITYTRRGDTLVVTSMDRLARSLEDLLSIVKELANKGVAVKFLKEGQTYSNSNDPYSTLMLAVIGAVAEFERQIIRERQAEGIARAKKRGVYDRGTKLSPEQINEARKMVDLGVPKAQVARQFGISRSGLYNYLNEDSGHPEATPDPQHG